jgi:TolB-like protein
MKHSLVVSIIFFFCITISCAQTSKVIETSEKDAVKSVRHLEGLVTSIQNNMVSIKISLPEINTANLPFANRVTQRIIYESILAEGTSLQVNSQHTEVIKLEDNILSVIFSTTPDFTKDSMVKIDIPKRTIAITDFEVIRGPDKTAGIVSMESLITAMVNSNQFNVVERYKLKAILKEKEIGLLGLTDIDQAKKAGQYLSADYILTGTFADFGGYWNVNMRLINAKNGLILSAVEERAEFANYNPTMIRDSSNIDENFENELKPGWRIASTTRNRFNQSIQIDRENGAAGTNTSIKNTFELLSHQASATILNIRKRDLSFFSGIEFFIKSDSELIVTFTLVDENRNDSHEKDLWFQAVRTTQIWKKCRIRFDALSQSNGWQRRYRQSDGVLSLDLVSEVGFVVSSRANPTGVSGTFWIDEVKFF